MVSVINDLPPYVAAFTATGDVTSEDYKNIVVPVIDKVAVVSEKINFLFELRTSVGNFEPGAWANDIAVGLKHLSKWGRMAIVSDQDLVPKVSQMIGHLMPGTVKGFKLGELAAAREWVSEKD